MFNKRVSSLIKNNKTIVENFSYITLLQVFVMICPLLTYPYLTRVLGMDLFGVVITAQVMSNYATIIIRFGFDGVSARHISINRDNKDILSSIMSSICFTRIALWFICFLIYIIVVLAIPTYREYLLLFLFSYGLTLQILLFPQFFFQGIEEMKFIAIINLIIQAVFVSLTFIVIKEQSDYSLVPLLYTAGYFVGGIFSFYLILVKYGVKLRMPSTKEIKYYFNDALPLFATDAVCTIKDKLNYLLLGFCVGMGDVVIYDVGAKLTSLATQPLQIINTVVFPRMAKEKNNKFFMNVGLIILACIILLVALLNVFLPYVVHFFVGKTIDLSPVRLYLLSPIFLGLGSYIASSLIIARGYNKYMFYSIIVTTIAYLVTLLILYLSGVLNTVIAFVSLTVIAYFVEMVYRIIIGKRIIKNESDKNC